MLKIDLITCRKHLNNNNNKQQNRNILPGCSCTLQSCDSLLDPRQLSDESPQDKQFLVAKKLNDNNNNQQSRNILPGCSCVLQSCDSLLVPLQWSDGSPQDEQFLVRDCWPPQAVAEQVPHASQDDHTKYTKRKQYASEIWPEWYIWFLQLWFFWFSKSYHEFP